uniref:Secreted protein n=1 Tax=Heterorhabditis bacteriophora TaxID=37862 RepID=A0A1I7W8X7_HETBA
MPRYITITFYVLSIITTTCIAHSLKSKEYKASADYIQPISNVKEAYGKYITSKDKQLDSESHESTAVPCVPGKSEDSELRSVISLLEEGKARPTNDTTSFNETEVEDTMELRIFHPLCDN